MPVRRKIDNNSGIYSITFTCLDWLSLFEICNAYSGVYNWFDIFKSKRHYILGYTIMPNHLHAIIAFCNTAKSINSIIGNGKRFIAYEVIEILEKQNNTEVLNRLGIARSKKEIDAGKLHKVFKTSFDWKWCNSEKMIEQKLNYIHTNPCKRKWDLALTPAEYLHSSAKYYLTGEQGIYPVTHYKSIEDIDLHTLRSSITQRPSATHNALRGDVAAK
jgi:hypothetical protein